ncbi:unnamed protein product [Vitrella brassicaformis CCMP3155]|uniref:Uncharacterized protein n=1 Tax=Vitrella brassicaformis (strain CCMP3155) TaxID=1169540 RepID=A0A0G4EKB4_VITBC|nr:unnamed protein product [Vitrella brassicaformis CCMP3155]|eukprot:CEL97124.1 unnamed protein product [Vitrella brassicaformis CCMP3155]
MVVVKGNIVRVSMPLGVNLSDSWVVERADRYGEQTPVHASAPVISWGDKTMDFLKMLAKRKARPTSIPMEEDVNLSVELMKHNAFHVASRAQRAAAARGPRRASAFPEDFVSRGPYRPHSSPAGGSRAPEVASQSEKRPTRQQSEPEEWSIYAYGGRRSSFIRNACQALGVSQQRLRGRQGESLTASLIGRDTYAFFWEWFTAETEDTEPFPTGLCSALIVDVCTAGVLIGLLTVVSVSTGVVLSTATFLYLMFVGLALTTTLRSQTVAKAVMASLVAPVASYCGGVLGIVIPIFFGESHFIFVFVLSFSSAALLYFVAEEIALEAGRLATPARLVMCLSSGLSGI